MNIAAQDWENLLIFVIIQFRIEDIVNFPLIFVNNALTICGSNLCFLRLFRNAGTGRTSHFVSASLKFR